MCLDCLAHRVMGLLTQMGLFWAILIELDIWSTKSVTTASMPVNFDTHGCISALPFSVVSLSTSKLNEGQNEPPVVFGLVVCG